jgi:hypothetical protein
LYDNFEHSLKKLKNIYIYIYIYIYIILLTFSLSCLIGKIFGFHILSISYIFSYKKLN